VTLSLLLAGRRVAASPRRRPDADGVRTRGFTLVLSRGARRTLLRRRSLRVIAIATARDLAERTFSVLPSGPPSNGRPLPSGGESGGSSLSDRRAPRILIRPRRARVSSKGIVALGATCPTGELSCRVQLRLELRRGTVATRTLTLVGGRIRSFRLQLSPAARRRLARQRSLRVVAAANASDRAGNRATTRTSVWLLAPRRR
jgi:hypothetical protein